MIKWGLWTYCVLINKFAVKLSHHRFSLRYSLQGDFSEELRTETLESTSTIHQNKSVESLATIREGGEEWRRKTGWWRWKDRGETVGSGRRRQKEGIGSGWEREGDRKREVAGEGEYLTAPCDLRSQDCYAILSRGHAPDKTHDLKPSAATISPSKGKLCFSFRGSVVFWLGGWNTPIDGKLHD